MKYVIIGFTLLLAGLWWLIAKLDEGEVLPPNAELPHYVKQKGK